MEKFTTRVELHNIEGGALYEKLHEEMEKEGFSRIIKDNEGIKYHLPNAEYNKIGDFTREQVLNSAKRACNKVIDDYSILVTESNGRTWHNLEKVK